MALAVRRPRHRRHRGGRPLPATGFRRGSTVTVTLSGLGDADLFAWFEESAVLGCAADGPFTDESCALVAPPGGDSLAVAVVGYLPAAYTLEVCGELAR